MEGTITIPSVMTNSQNRHITDIFKNYNGRLKGFIRKRVENEADAEDILQDVFYQLTEAIQLTRPIEQLTSWLFTVARNKITDSYRKKKPEPLENFIAPEDADAGFILKDFVADASGDPETVYLRSLFREALQEALEELPREQKEVFILHELEDIPFKEIAAATGESVNTLISRKRYAVLHLRERLRVVREELLNF